MKHENSKHDKRLLCSTMSALTFDCIQFMIVVRNEEKEKDRREAKHEQTIFRANYPYESVKQKLHPMKMM